LIAIALPNSGLPPKGKRRRWGSLQRTVIVTLGSFGLGSLGGSYRRHTATLERSLAQAIRYYLADRDSGRAGWLYPDFRHRNHDGLDVELQINVEEAVWHDLSKEADRQGVSTDHLLQHAALYFVAERDSGRLAQRIISDLGKSEV
jgi:hypothetical protein